MIRETDLRNILSGFPFQRVVSFGFSYIESGMMLAIASHYKIIIISDNLIIITTISLKPICYHAVRYVTYLISLPQQAY